MEDKGNPPHQQVLEGEDPEGFVPFPSSAQQSSYISKTATGAG